jgi:hypothetical protein
VVGRAVAGDRAGYTNLNTAEYVDISSDVVDDGT